MDVSNTIIIRFRGARFVIVFEGRFGVWRFNFIAVFLVLLYADMFPI